MVRFPVCQNETCPEGTNVGRQTSTIFGRIQSASTGEVAVSDHGLRVWDFLPTGFPQAHHLSSASLGGQVNKRLHQPATGQLRILPQRQMPRSPSESVIKANILKALSRLPYCLFVNTPSGKLQVNGGWFHAGCRGFPDLSGVVNVPMRCRPDGWTIDDECAVPVYLEVKTDTGKLSGDQIAMHERLRALGAKVAVVRSVREAVDFVIKVRGG